MSESWFTSVSVLEQPQNKAADMTALPERKDGVFSNRFIHRPFQISQQHSDKFLGPSVNSNTAPMNATASVLAQLELCSSSVLLLSRLEYVHEIAAVE
jgi:hypothetical protein